MTAPAKAGTAGQHRGVFAVDEDAVLATRIRGTLADQAATRISQ